jgi:hypothetical protein
MPADPQPRDCGLHNPLYALQGTICAIRSSRYCPWPGSSALLTVMLFGMPLDVIDIIGIILLIGIVKSPIGADIEVALDSDDLALPRSKLPLWCHISGKLQWTYTLQLPSHLLAVGHHRASLNRSFTETSIWDAVIPAGKGGNCPPRINRLRVVNPASESHELTDPERNRLRRSSEETKVRHRSRR